MLKSSTIVVNLIIILVLSILFIQEIIQNWIWYEDVKKAENIIVNLGFSYQMSDSGSIAVKILFISWIVLFGLFQIFQYIFSEQREKKLDNLLSGIYFLLFLSYLLLPAFNPVIITDTGIFYPFEYIAWEEVESVDRPVWLEDTFYIDRKKFRLTSDNKDKVEAILKVKLDPCY